MILKVIPFLISFCLLPPIFVGLIYGGVWAVAPILITLFAAPLVDELTSLNEDNLDPLTEETSLFWHALVLWAWVPTQCLLILFFLYVVGQTDWLVGWEKIAAAISVGLAVGGIGITYSHELIHQKNKFERTLGEILACSALYGHFCIEHIFGHHIRVATPDDPATARENETVYEFLPRVMICGFLSAWEIQANQLKRRGLPIWSRRNAFWRYGAWAMFWLSAAYLLGGWQGVGCYILMAFIAAALLEMVNYIEHYGLLRRKLPNGKYEPVKPYHSWNSNHRATNYLLINLQRHSDHHYKPDRRFPLLQAYSEDEAPQLPYGYAISIFLTLIPPLWFSFMAPRLRRWREKFQGDLAHKEGSSVRHAT